LRPSRLCENEYGKAASFDSVSGWHVCHLGWLQAPAVRYREIRGTVQQGSWIVKFPVAEILWCLIFITRRQESVRDIAKKIQEKKALDAAQSAAAADTALPGAGDYGTGSSPSNTSAQ